MKTDRFAVQRLTDPARAGELLALAHAAFGALDIDPPSSVLRETEADFAARLRSEICLIIAPEGRIIASVFCAPQGDAFYIGRLAVAPDWRRRGVASALIETAKDEARRRGARRITLKARIALASNVALFRRHGFVITAQETHAGYPAPTSYAMEWPVA